MYCWIEPRNGCSICTTHLLREALRRALRLGGEPYARSPPTYRLPYRSLFGILSVRILGYTVRVSNSDDALNLLSSNCSLLRWKLSRAQTGDYRGALQCTIGTVRNGQTGNVGRPSGSNPL